MQLTKEEIETAIEMLQENLDLRYSIPICATLQNKVCRFLKSTVVSNAEEYPFSGYMGYFVSTKNVKHHFANNSIKLIFLPANFYRTYNCYVEDDGRSLKEESLPLEVIKDIEAYSDTRKEVCRVFIGVLEKELEKVNEA